MIEKLSSGRFWLAIIAGSVFAYVACKTIIPPEATVVIIVMVFKDYFSRDRKKEV